MLRVFIAEHFRNILDAFRGICKQSPGKLHPQLAQISEYRRSEQLLKPLFQFKLVERANAAEVGQNEIFQEMALDENFEVMKACGL